MEVLEKTRTYLVGHMQYANGRNWRDHVEEELQIIINDILADAGDIQVNLTSETGRNFVSKRIIEVFWPK